MKTETKQELFTSIELYEDHSELPIRNVEFLQKYSSRTDALESILNRLLKETGLRVEVNSVAKSVQQLCHFGQGQ
jgi:hypothetical protein